VIKGFIRALTPTVIIPVCLIFLIFWVFGLTPSSVLLIVMIAQFYLIWSQVEVALRQAKLSELSYEPVFIARIEEAQCAVFVEGAIIHTSFHIKVKNVANYPAYNLIAYLESATRAALPNFELSKSIIGVLGKDQEETICILSEKDVKRMQGLQKAFIVNVDYDNVLGEGGGASFIFQPQNLSSPITICGRRRLPGLLLNSTGELIQLIRLVRWSRRMKKLTKLQNV
jgi:hypothetical protein